jgi:hypothetical protein
MQLVDRTIHTACFDRDRSAGRLPESILYRRLSIALTVGILACLGPAVLSAAAGASLLTIKIAMQASHLAFVAFQIFGTFLGQ